MLLDFCNSGLYYCAVRRGHRWNNRGSGIFLWCFFRTRLQRLIIINKNNGVMCNKKYYNDKDLYSSGWPCPPLFCDLNLETLTKPF